MPCRFFSGQRVEISRMLVAGADLTSIASAILRA